MKKIILIISAIICQNSFSQKRISSETPSLPYIEVTGTAYKEITPDKIYVSITLTDKSTSNQKYSIDEQEIKFKTALQKLGIDLNNLTLSDLNSNIILKDKKESGIKQTKEFTLILKNSDEASKVFQEFDELNIKQADVFKTENSKIEDYRKEVRIAAIKNAKEKANYLLEEIGKKIGEPQEIKELPENDFNYYRGNTFGRKSTLKSEENDFEKFTIKFSYSVKYLIN